MSEQGQNQWQWWICGAIIGLLAGWCLATCMSGDTSPTQELAQWVEAGFSDEESRILVAYGRTQLLPTDIRRLAQAGAPTTQARQPEGRASQQPPPKAATPPRHTQLTPAEAARQRLRQGCQNLQAGNHTTARGWFTAMHAQGNPWAALAKRVQGEVPPQQQIAALQDAWRKLCVSERSSR